jgi:exodeoxyribonuclease VII small subunit
MKTNKELSFEKAYARLEEILKAMNEPQTTLEDSLKLFEEADSLIQSCNEKLHNAEQKIEILLKNRNGAIAVNEDGEPIREAFLAHPTGAL